MEDKQFNKFVKNCRMIGILFLLIALFVLSLNGCSPYDDADCTSEGNFSRWWVNEDCPDGCAMDSRQIFGRDGCCMNISFIYYQQYCKT